MPKFIIVLLIALFQTVQAEVVDVEQLHFYADGLNIEGGIIPSEKLNPNQLWANLAIVLDRPIITGETLDVITEKNAYALKEASIIDYDEVKANTAYAAILHYYLQHGRRDLNKDKNKPVKLLVHIHRNRSARAHFQLIKQLLQPLIDSGQLVEQTPSADQLGIMYYRPTNSQLEVRKGFQGEALEQNSDTDIVISLSMVAGLNPSYESGTLLIPTKFLPYKVETSELLLSNQYSEKNDLLRIMPEIKNSPFKLVLNQITKTRSENTEKLEYQARPLKFQDFRVATILQADGYFYPK